MVDGVVFLDKPSGITSMEAVKIVRRLFHTKAGHTGTLDPIASGLLIVLLGQATRFSEFFIELDKVYLVDALLGERTDTFDCEGKIIEKREVNLNCEDIISLLGSFIGEKLQKPPVFSAKKVAGERAYKLARAGLQVDLKESKVFIRRAELIKCDLPLIQILFEVSSGTYIRSLIDELGQTLGCGAHVIALRRLEVGPFSLKDAVKPKELSQKDIQKPDKALCFLPELSLSANEARRVLSGAFLHLPDYHKNGFYRLYMENLFIGVGYLENKTLKPYRLLSDIKSG